MNPNKPRILIVEDDPVTQSIFLNRLKHLKYHIIDIVAEGEKAVSIAVAKKPDLILMDIILAGKMNGIEAARHICSIEPIPIIFITGDTDLQRIHDAKNALTYGYLKKPVDEISMYATIETVLGRVLAEKAEKAALLKTQKHQAEIDALTRVSKGILSRKDFNEQVQIIYENCKASIGASIGYVALLNQETKKEFVIFVDTGNNNCNISEDTPVPISGFREKAYQTSEVLFDNAFQSKEYYNDIPKDHLHIENILFAPLLDGKKVVGLLGLGNKPGGFIPADAALAGAFGELMSIALQNSQLLEQLNTRIKELSCLSELEAIINAEHKNMDAMLQEVVYALAHFFPIPIKIDVQITCSDSIYQTDGFATKEKIEIDKERIEQPLNTGTKDRLVVVYPNNLHSQYKQFQKEQILLLIQTIAGRMEHAIEKRLHEEKLKYHAFLFEQLTDAIIETDLQFRIKSWNKAAEEMYQWAESEVLGTELDSLLNTHYHQQGDTAYFKELLENHQWQGEVKQFTKQGEPRFIQSSISMHLDTANKPISIIVVNRDISMHKQMQALVIQSDKMSSIGTLAAGMAHEINNPLATIISGVQGIKRRFSAELPRNKEIAAQLKLDLSIVHDYMEKQNIVKYMLGIEEAAKRSAELVAHLLDFSRTNNKKHRLYNVNTIISNAVELAYKDYELRKKYNINDIDIHFNLKEPSNQIYCIPSEIEQVILNIIKNAVHAIAKYKESDEKSYIRISNYTQDNWEVIEISDNGPGMTEKIKNQIFDPFFTTKEANEGTGLGLAIAYYIIHNTHQGRIQVESKLDSGTTLSLFLPGEIISLRKEG